MTKRTGYGGFIRDTVPGAADGGPVPAIGDWTARVRGGNANQNSFMLEGFLINGQKVTLNSLAAMEVQSAASGAENAGTPGVVVNMVTQSGSNRLRARRHRLARGQRVAAVSRLRRIPATRCARASSTRRSRGRSSRTSSGSI
jgi:hypothetical protein